MWNLKYTDGFYTFTQLSSVGTEKVMCLDVQNMSTSAGANVVMSVGNGSNAQKWCVIKDEATDTEINF
ncbi:MAG: RICIN domain-containing protein [Bacteroidales bacterium]|nr:RICIN domain-containing protein [Bacteroidales bacterium]